MEVGIVNYILRYFRAWHRTLTDSSIDIRLRLICLLHPGVWIVVFIQGWRKKEGGFS